MINTCKKYFILLAIIGNAYSSELTKACCEERQGSELTKAYYEEEEENEVIKAYNLLPKNKWSEEDRKREKSSLITSSMEEELIKEKRQENVCARFFKKIFGFMNILKNKLS